MKYVARIVPHVMLNFTKANTSPIYKQDLNLLISLLAANGARTSAGAVVTTNLDAFPS